MTRYLWNFYFLFRIFECQEDNTQQFGQGLGQQNVNANMNDLNVKGRQYCDRLFVNNVDVGFNKETEFEKMNSAIKEMINLLEGLQKKKNLEKENAAKTEKTDKTEKTSKTEKISENLKESSTVEQKINEDIVEQNRVLPDLFESVINNASDRLSELRFESMNSVLAAALKNKKN